MSTVHGRVPVLAVPVPINSLSIKIPFPQKYCFVINTCDAHRGEFVFGDYKTFEPTEDFFGALVQYPNADGSVEDYRAFAVACNAAEVQLVVAADIMSLVLLTPPGEWGADAVVGTTQRFGIPLGYGGPHAGFFSTKEHYKRFIPGRIIGRTIDTDGNPALRMALQTREQHIKRTATSGHLYSPSITSAYGRRAYGYTTDWKDQSIALTIHLHSTALNGQQMGRFSTIRTLSIP